MKDARENPNYKQLAKTDYAELQAQAEVERLFFEAENVLLRGDFDRRYKEWLARLDAQIAEYKKSLNTISKTERR